MMRRVRFVSEVAGLVLVVFSTVSLEAADFIRGDVNGDGRVSISDAYRFRMWIFDGRELECLDAADLNDDERLDSIDWARIIHHLEAESRGGGGRSEIGIPPMPAPFPSPGPDLTDDLDAHVDCASYGGAEPLADPAAELKVLDAVAPGAGDDRALIRIVLSNSVPIAARSGLIRFPDSIVREIAGWNTGMGFRSGQDRFWFGHASYETSQPVAPGSDLTAVEILVYLKEGVPAGEYPIVLESGELTDTETGRAIVPRLADGTLVVQETITSVPSGTADFVRGDINGDGRVSISDAYRLRMWSDDYFPPQCLDAADVNDDGRLNSEDGIHLLRAQYQDGPPIPSPFASPGNDPTDDLDLTTDCRAYGGGVILEDPASELGVSATVARGGDGSEAMLYLALTNSVPIGAIFAQVRFLDPVLDGVGGLGIRGGIGGGWSFRRMTGEDRFVFGLTIGSSEYVLPPGQHAYAVDIRACLKAGTPPGEYAFVIESAELTSAETGQAIVPRVAGGTLTVESTVSGADLGQCEGASNPGQPRPEDVTGGFTVGNATVPPGGVFTVPFTIVADAPIEGYSFSIDFDEEVLEVLSAEYIWPEPAGTAYLVHYVDFDNRNDAPGNAGVDEGYVVGASVLKPSGEQQPTMAPDVEHAVVEIRFQVRPGASETTTMLRFLDRGRRTNGQEVLNILSTYGFSVTPYISNSFAFLDGRVSIVADVATFVRGDASGDGVVDIADPVMTLNFLYQGDSPPACYDAADANDDARLDVSDPIATLGFLFLGTGMPGPYPEAGADPTPDSMGCRYMQ